MIKEKIKYYMCKMFHTLVWIDINSIYGNKESLLFCKKCKVCRSQGVVVYKDAYKRIIRRDNYFKKYINER